MDLASYEDLGELSEEAFQAMVGDLLAARRRVEELAKLKVEYTKQRTRLTSTKAYDCWSSYRSAQLELEAFDEQAAPALARLEQEKADKQKLVEILEGHLKKLLPEGIWIRYGDEAIRRVDESPYERAVEEALRRHQLHVPGHRQAGDSLETYHMKVPQLHLAKWKDVAPIPQTIRRTGSKHEGPSWVGQKLRASYEYGLLSNRYAPMLGIGSLFWIVSTAVLSVLLTPYAFLLWFIFVPTFIYSCWRG